MADINRVKVVFCREKENEQVASGAIRQRRCYHFQWCTNSAQPSLETLLEIAKVLDVDPRELIVPIDSQKVMMSIL
jgi:transcriptional regulator with XRE-family HTH domain